MGLLELYNQVNNGILPSGEDQKHIDNMPLGNPQWKNFKDTTTTFPELVKSVSPINGINPIEGEGFSTFTQQYTSGSTYLDTLKENGITIR